MLQTQGWRNSEIAASLDYKPVVIADISGGFAAICRFSASVLFLAGLTVDLFAMQMVQFSLQFLIV